MLMSDFFFQMNCISVNCNVQKDHVYSVFGNAIAPPTVLILPHHPLQ